MAPKQTANADASPALSAAEFAAQLTLDLAPLPPISLRPFRSELTIEQQSLFVSNSYKGDSFEREVMSLDPLTGEPVLSRVVVGKLHDDDKGHGVLRQCHQDALYKLLELWDRQGYPAARFVHPTNGTTRELGVIQASVYELVSLLCPGDDSSSAYKRVKELLNDMRVVPIQVENVSTWQGWVGEKLFYLLGDYSWDAKKVDRKTKRILPGGSSSVMIWFSEFITASFKAQHFRTLLAQPYEQLSSGAGRKGEIARLIYPLIDRQLAQAQRFEAPLKSLAALYGLQTHIHASKRKTQFTPAIRALQGKQILEGKYTLNVTLREIPKDYLLCCARVRTA